MNSLIFSHVKWMIDNHLFFVCDFAQSVMKGGFFFFFCLLTVKLNFYSKHNFFHQIIHWIQCAVRFAWQQTRENHYIYCHVNGLVRRGMLPNSVRAHTQKTLVHTHSQRCARAVSPRYDIIANSERFNPCLCVLAKEHNRIRRSEANRKKNRRSRETIQESHTTSWTTTTYI